jgi:uncharacterized integral membrane protein
MEDKNKIDRYLEAKKQVSEIKGFYIHLLVYIIVNLFIIFGIFSKVKFEEINFWMFSTAFFWGIGLFFHGFAVFGKNLVFNKEWEERKIREIMEKDKNEYWE